MHPPWHSTPFAELDVATGAVIAESRSRYQGFLSFLLSLEKEVPK